MPACPRAGRWTRRIKWPQCTLPSLGSDADMPRPPPASSQPGLKRKSNPLTGETGGLRREPPAGSGYHSPGAARRLRSMGLRRQSEEWLERFGAVSELLHLRRFQRTETIGDPERGSEQRFLTRRDRSGDRLAQG